MDTTAPSSTPSSFHQSWAEIQRVVGHVPGDLLGVSESAVHCASRPTSDETKREPVAVVQAAVPNGCDLCGDVGRADIEPRAAIRNRQDHRVLLRCDPVRIGEEFVPAEPADATHPPDDIPRTGGDRRIELRNLTRNVLVRDAEHRLLHAHRGAAAPSQTPEELPVIDDSGWPLDAWLDPLCEGPVKVRLQGTGQIVSLIRQARGYRVVRLRDRVRRSMVQRDEQFQTLECPQGERRVRQRAHGVATGDNERPDPVPAGMEDLGRKQCSRVLAREGPDVR
jgi:hypothetical protein